jgi:ABC-type nickel/cobalt efflux system permease component RcnA
VLLPLASEHLGLWVAAAVAVVALGALIALAQGRRTRLALASAIIGVAAVVLIVYFGYFLLLSGD